ncbi:MAG: hypothetical protein K8I02_06545 [Candidatus Methylomirabilis sp.]|nr:hypothetical protein [Deltaproteobacteria bacterium]
MLSYLCDRCGAPIAGHELMVTVRDCYRCRNFHRSPCAADILDALRRVATPPASRRPKVALASSRVA